MPAPIVDPVLGKSGNRNVGLVGVEWDEAAQTATINYVHKPSVTFEASQIPGNVPKTVAGYQAWADANVQQFLNAKGFEAFIRVQIRSVHPTTGFVTLGYLIFGVQEDADAYVFPNQSMPPGSRSRALPT